MAKQQRLPNKRKPVLRRHSFRVWRTVAMKLGSFMLASTPAFLFPLALVTKVEDKQTTLTLVLAIISSTVSIIILARFFKSLIISTLDQHASSH